MFIYIFYPCTIYETSRKAWFSHTGMLKSKYKGLVLTIKKACEELSFRKSNQRECALVPNLNISDTNFEKSQFLVNFWSNCDLIVFGKNSMRMYHCFGQISPCSYSKFTGGYFLRFEEVWSMNCLVRKIWDWSCYVQKVWTSLDFGIVNQMLTKVKTSRFWPLATLGVV